MKKSMNCTTRTTECTMEQEGQTSFARTPRSYLSVVVPRSSQGYLLAQPSRMRSAKGRRSLCPDPVGPIGESGKIDAGRNREPVSAPRFQMRGVDLETPGVGRRFDRTPTRSPRLALGSEQQRPKRAAGLDQEGDLLSANLNHLEPRLSKVQRRDRHTVEYRKRRLENRALRCATHAAMDEKVWQGVEVQRDGYRRVRDAIGPGPREGAGDRVSGVKRPHSGVASTEELDGELPHGEIPGGSVRGERANL